MFRHKAVRIMTIVFLGCTEVLAVEDAITSTNFMELIKNIPPIASAFIASGITAFASIGVVILQSHLANTQKLKLAKIERLEKLHYSLVKLNNILHPLYHEYIKEAMKEIPFNELQEKFNKRLNYQQYLDATIQVNTYIELFVPIKLYNEFIKSLEVLTVLFHNNPDVTSDLIKRQVSVTHLTHALEDYNKASHKISVWIQENHFFNKSHK